MYVPKFYREDDPEVLTEWMRRHSFALIVSADARGVPMATHMPVAHECRQGSKGVLVSHMARANPQWRHFRDEPVLVVFSGPHTYVSPTWYEAAGSVPTWNYTAVHAWGVPKVIENPERLKALLDDLVATHETSGPAAYRPDWSDPRTVSMLRAIVGFELEITRLEGKSKMSQNKSEADRRGVIRALEQSADPGDRAVASIMTGHLNQS